MKDTQLLMKTAMLAGELMLCSGAETYRVEDTMHHILKTAEDVEEAEIVVLMTGISAMLKCKGEAPVTMIKRVADRGTNLSRMVEVNAISRKYCGQYLTLDKAYEKLLVLKERKYPAFPVSIIGICAGFALFFGGTLSDAAAAAVTGVALAGAVFVGNRLKIHAFVQDVGASVLVAFVVVLLKGLMGSSMNMDSVMISAIMPLVPGVAITNAVRDTLRGDYVSGAARTLEAFLKAAGIALGIGIGLAVFGGIIAGGI